MESIFEILADGLDASTDGRGWDARHERARTLANAAPAMLAALTEAAEFLGCLSASPEGQRRGPMADRIRAAIAAATNGERLNLAADPERADLLAPTDEAAGVWRIVNGEAESGLTLYWSNSSGWGSLAASDAYTAAERESLNLPMGGRWWFDADEGEPTPTTEPARATSEATPEQIARARSEYGGDDLEIDDSEVRTSLSEGGVWVSAWVWLADEPWACARCGNTDQDGSDTCPDCGEAMGEG